MRASRLGLLLAVVLMVPAGTAQASLTDADGQPVAATDWSSARAQVVGEPGCAAGAAGLGCRVLAEPATPADDDAAALAALGSSNSPEDDLAAALGRLAAAPDAAAAEAARAEALAILEGDELPGARPYEGIPLLNWNAPAKVKSVPAGGAVEIREVRFPGHAISDAWLVDFEDPARPYTIRYRVSELGGTAGGELKPAPLLEGGLGGVHSALLPLLVPELATGTFDRSRFTDARGLDRAHESSRVAEQVVEVRMPAPGLTRAILQPSTRGPAPALFTLQPATTERVAAATKAFGFSGRSPSPAERTAAIERLAPEAPERMLWEDLHGLTVDAPTFLDDARGIGDQDGVLIDAMRTRGALPSGTGADPDADVTLLLQNGETYVSRTSLRPSGVVRIAVENRDGFPRRVSALALYHRRAVLGADDWGRFSWMSLDGVDVPARGSATLAVELPAGAFSLWLGDADTGDQAATMVALEKGPRTQSIAPTPDVGAAPLHQAVDAAGDHWLTLAGADAIVRLTPAADLAQSARAVSLIPGGRHSAASTAAPLEPSDIAVDQRGVVWSTLALGNAIARIDPARARDGTTAGVRVYPLPACRDEDECPAVFPPEPGERLTRQPLQMKVAPDAAGNTLVWFTEANVDRVGLLRVAPDGTELGQTHFSCGCAAPLGLALDQGGDVWFTEGVSNRIGRLTPAAGQPQAAAGARLRHYVVPSAILVSVPELSPDPVLTSNPHSLAIDRRGLVWFSESATSKLGVLDPSLARPGTTEGFREIELPRTDFGTPATPADLTVDRAGTVFWTDEYGDIVGTVETSGPRSQWAPGRSLRPAARRSLTDSPLADPAGDLWFLEAGANRITRVSGVSAGNPLVAPRPDVVVDLSADTLAVSGLAEAEVVDVRIVRGGVEVVVVSGVAVRGGAAAVSAWGVADALRPGDVVAVQPHGPDLQAAFATELPGVAAQAVAGGVSGEAQLAGRPLGGVVKADDGRVAAIAADGAFRLAGSAAFVTWTAATPGAAWHIRAAVAPAAPTPNPTPAQPATIPPSSSPVPTTSSSPAPTTSSPAPTISAPAPTISAPAPTTSWPAPTTSSPAPTTSSSAPSTSSSAPSTSSPTGSGRASASCPRRWLVASRPAFLGMTAAAAERCLGRPRSRRGAMRRFAGGLVLEIRRGRVAALILTAPGWSSARGGLAIGAHARAVRAALPAARRDPRLGVERAVLPLPAGRAADIRVTVRRGRVHRIAVRAVARTALDRTGRARLGAA